MEAKLEPSGKRINRDENFSEEERDTHFLSTKGMKKF
jgi:hypothetical protein